MSKFTHDDVLNTPLNFIKGTAITTAGATKLTVCSGNPATYSDANVTNMLAEITIDSSDFTLADGTTGRKATVGQQTGTVTNSGTAATVCLLDVANSRLLVRTDLSASRSLSASDSITVNEFAITFADVTA